MGIPDKIALESGPVFQPAFNEDGLIPAIASDHDTGTVLMVAWMNQTALDMTLRTNVAHFWSRSRAKLWRKGEESGNTLEIVEMRTDCDQDVIWLRVRMKGDGKACHTGRTSCFYRRIEHNADGGIALVDVGDD